MRALAKSRTSLIALAAALAALLAVGAACLAPSAFAGSEPKAFTATSEITATFGQDGTVTVPDVELTNDTGSPVVIKAAAMQSDHAFVRDWTNDAAGKVIEPGETLTIKWSAGSKVPADWDKSQKLHVGTVSYTYEQVRADISGAAIETEELTYTGAEQTAKVKSVTLPDGTVLSEGDYRVVSGDKGTDAGEYGELVIEGTGSYAGKATGSFAISPKGYTVTTDSDTKVYDGTALTAPGRIDGIVEGEDAGFAVTGSQTSAGSSKNAYEVKWNGTAKQSNYQLEKETVGALEVTPAKATVAANGASKVYGEADPELTATVTGTVNGEDESLIKYTVSRSNPDVEEVGAYAGAIVASGDELQGNYSVSYVNGDLAITAQSIVPDGSEPDSYKGITISDPSDVVYNGVEQEWAPVVKGSKGNVLVAGTDYTVAYSEDTANVGTVTATVQGTGNYTGTSVKSYEITAAPLTVSTPSASKVYDGTALTAAATAESITGLVNGETAAVVANGSQKDKGCSDNGYTIEWGTAASANYYIQSESLGLLTVTAKPIVPSAGTGIAVNDPVSVTYDGQEHKWAPVVTDGDKALAEGTDYEVSYNGREDFTNVDGLISVTVTGNGNYDGSFSRAYRIDPAAVSVVTESASKAYDGTALTAEGTLTGLVNNETAAFSTTGSQTTVGSSANWYRIDWSGTAKQSNYTVSEALGTLTVTESANVVVVTTTGYDGTYDGKEHAAAVAVSNLPAGYTAEAISNAKATDANGDGIAATVDTLVIRNTEGADVTSDLNVEYVNGTIRIAPAALKVATPSAKKEYNGSALTAEGTLTGLVNGETAAFSTTGSQTAVGESDNTYMIDWDADGYTAKQSNYTVAEESIGELEVTPNATAICVVPNNATKVYDGTALTGDGAAVKGVPAGFTYEVTTKGSQTDKGYSCAEVGTFKILDAVGNDVTGNFSNINTEFKGGLVVTARPVTLTSAAEQKVYDGSALIAHAATASPAGEGTGMVAGQAFDLEFFGSQTAAGSSANTFVAKSSSSANVDNYDIAYSYGTLEVTPAKATVTANGATKVYGDNDPELTATVSGMVNDEPASLIMYKVSNSSTVKAGAGTHKGAIVPSGEKLQGNYEVSYVSADLVVSKRPVTLKSEGYAFTYNGEPQKWEEAGIAEGSFAEGEGVASYSFDESVTNVGDEADNTFTYVLEEGTEASNYDIKTEYGKLTVVKSGNLRVDGKGYSGTYDGQAHGEAAVPNVAEGTAVKYSTDGGSNWTEDVPTVKDAGELEVKARATNPNYTDAECDYTIEVTKRKVTFTGETGTKSYTGSEQELTGITSDNLADGQTWSGLSYSAKGADPGSYDGAFAGELAIKAGGEDVTANYEATKAPGRLTIAKSDIAGYVTLTGAPASKTYDGKALSAGIATANDENGHDVKVEYQKADGAWTEDPSDITATDVADSTTVNVRASVEGYYEGYVYATEALTVAKSGAMTVSGKDYSGTYDGQAHGEAAVATVTEGTTVEYSVDGEKTWTKDVPTVKDAGELEVKARATNGNYEDASASYTLKVSPKGYTVTTYSNTKVYDGTALMANGCIDGIVAGENAGFAVTGSQTEVGSSSNTYEVNWNGNAKQSNYCLEREYLGTLTVAAQSIVPGADAYRDVRIDDPEGATYDGAAHKWAPKVTGRDGKALVEGTDYNVAYTRGGAVTEDFASAGAIEVAITGMGNYTGTVARSYEIAKRSVALTSGNGYKVYDGTPLTNGEVTVSGDGFASGEGATYDVTGTITDYGSVENAFTYSLNGNTKADNYTIATIPGTLRVAQVTDEVTVTITGNTGSTTYDGTAHSVEGYTASIGGSTLYTEESIAFNGAAKAEGTDADSYYMGLSADKFRNTNANFSNVRFVVADGSLAIGKRDVALKSADLSKPYDGTALTNDGAALATETGWAEGEGAKCTFTGSQTLVGSSANAFTYTLSEGTKAGNYNIAKTEGTLSVANRDAKYEVTVKGESDAVTYDGEKHSVSGMTGTAYTNEKGVLFTVEGLSASGAEGTDAGSYANNITGTAVVKDASGNIVTDQFDVSVQNGELTISPVCVAVTWDSDDEYAYDGEPHGPTATVTGAVGDDDLSAVVSYADSVGTISLSAPSEAGSYTATARVVVGEGVNADNYVLPTAGLSKSFSIAKEPEGYWLAAAGADNPSDPAGVLKTKDQIAEDMAVLHGFQSATSAGKNKAAVTAEYTNYMNGKSADGTKEQEIRLYTKWNGSDVTDENSKDKYVEFRIVQVGSHDNGGSLGSDGSAVTFAATHSLPTAQRMNRETTNAGGWGYSDMRRLMLSGSYVGVGLSELRDSDAVYPTSKVTAYREGTSGNWELYGIVDEIWLLSVSEVFGTASDGNALISGSDSAVYFYDEGSQYDWFKAKGVNAKDGWGTANDAIKDMGKTRSGSGPAGSGYYTFWWLRSPDVDDSSSFGSVYSDGSPNDGDADSAFGVVPAFSM